MARDEAVPRVYLDTSVWLQSIMHQEPHDMCDRVLVAGAEGRIKIEASWMVRAEIQTVAGPEVPADVREAVIALLDNEGVTWIAVDRFIALDALSISQSLPKRLGGADAVHLATAVRRGCDYFMALDDGFPFGQAVNGVRVRRPEPVWQPDLFEATAEQ